MTHQTDCIIIGAGIAGISAAAELAPFMRVTILEAEAVIGYHASGRSAAMFLRDYGNAIIKDLNYASEAAHIKNEVLTPRALLLLGRDGDPFEADRDDLKLDEISLDQAKTYLPILNPQTVTRAALTTHSTALDTDLLLQRLLRSARGNSAEVHLKSAVTSASHDGKTWHLDTSGGAFSAPIVVNAAGAWADQIAALFGVAPIRLTPYRRSMAQLPAPQDHTIAQWPFTLGAGDRWYAKPIGGQWCVSPSEADATTPHDAYADDMVLAEGLARYEAMVTSPVTRVTGSWAGLRTFAPDRSLVIGPDATRTGFFWLAGQGGYGFQTAPAAAALLASQITGTPSALSEKTVSALSPTRF